MKEFGRNSLVTSQWPRRPWLCSTVSPEAIGGQSELSQWPGSLTSGPQHHSDLPHSISSYKSTGVRKGPDSSLGKSCRTLRGPTHVFLRVAFGPLTTPRLWFVCFSSGKQDCKGGDGLHPLCLVQCRAPSRYSSIVVERRKGERRCR